MRATPIPKASVPNVLPTPRVHKAVVRQVVDMRPQGATVAIRTIADNPFEARKPISIHTQASGGMSPADPSMQSRSLVHSFVPGIGQLSGATRGVGQMGEENQYLAAAKDALSTAGSYLSEREQRRQAEADAKARQAEVSARVAEAEAAKARAAADTAMAKIRSGVDATSMSIGGVRINVPLILLGVGLLGGAYYLKKKRR